MNHLAYFTLSGLLLLSFAVDAELTSAEQAVKARVQQSGFAPDPDEIGKHDLGTKDNPVRSNGADAQREYIESLDCENGAIPEYRRDPTEDIGPYGHMLDKYTLRCDGDTVEMYEIYLDAYHDELDTRPVKGFTSWL